MAFIPSGDSSYLKTPAFPSPSAEECEKREEKDSGYPTDDPERKLRMLCEILRLENELSACGVLQSKLEEALKNYVVLDKKFTRMSRQSDRLMKVVSDLYLRGKVSDSGPVKVISAKRLKALKRKEKDYNELDRDYEDLLAERDEWEAKCKKAEEENKRLSEQLKRKDGERSSGCRKRKIRRGKDHLVPAPSKKGRLEDGV